MESGEQPKKGGVVERIREALRSARRPQVSLHESGHPPPLVFSKPERAETYVKSIADAIVEGRPPSVIALLILDYFKTSVDEWLYSVTSNSDEYAFERFVNVVTSLSRSLNVLVARRLAELAASDGRLRQHWRDVYATFITALADAQAKFLGAVAGAIRLNRPGSNQLAWSKFGFVRA